MEPLALDPRDYTGTYKLIGGRICLDFVNTLAWPGQDREHDWLDPWTNVIDWSTASGLLSKPEADELTRGYAGDPVRVASAMAVLRRRRRVVRRLVEPLADGESPDRRATSELNDLLLSAPSPRKIDPVTLEWIWTPPECLEDVAAPVIFDAAELVVEADHRRVGKCTCGWLFYDQSRNRSRRWCDMADCGSRDKSLRYYHRQQAED